ncbi:MAG: hypothetical protein H6573_34315 [Lewinellaceae bacterium]|nr:hypothetical protein [Lewinellaceae bacterium]
MLDDNDDEINQEIEGYQKKKELDSEDLNQAFDKADEETQRRALQGLGKLSEELDGDTEKMQQDIEDAKREIAKNLGIDLSGKKSGKGNSKG